MLISQIRISDQNKETVYQHFSKDQDVVIFDRSYFANKWVSAINDDFYLILYISSFLIFFALWFSYGRIELTLMSFLPMLVSWVIILGLMGILGIEFNIINIILSTFIFGIGDDFSIFIMDGLQNKYRTGQKVLNSHKTAIFFSAFTTVVGMGALVFAKHPALQSISLISILGMIAVVLVAYTIQPLIFRFFIAGPASKGLPPYTLIGLIRTVLLFLLFFIGMELASVPMACLVAFDKYKRYSAEAGAKYILCALFASGLMLYGISFFYGTTGTLYFDDMAARITGSPLQIMAMVFFFAGLGFKISLVPFHLWTADTYQGAPTTVTSYLSVVSKGSAAFVLMTVLMKVFGPMIGQWQTLLYAVTVLSITVANLFAIRQKDLKRFLAFSSISQAGYIMLAVNNWDKEYQRVLLGGLTCDSEDFYNSECHTSAIFLPKLEAGNTQYIGFFHTGAYQESLGGFGGIQHCLIPAPKHVIIDRDKSDNEYYTRLFAKEQSYRSMLRILGY